MFRAALSRWFPLHHAAFPTPVVNGALHCPVFHSTRGLIFLPAEGLSFPFPPEGTMAENAFRKPCETIARIACLRPVPLLSKRAHSIASPGSSQRMFALVSRFRRFAPPAVAGVP
jgi:hypothetical protein